MGRLFEDWEGYLESDVWANEPTASGWRESPGDYAASHHSRWSPADDIEARLDLEILLRSRR